MQVALAIVLSLACLGGGATLILRQPSLRRRIADWLDRERLRTESPEQIYQQRKTDLYAAINGLTVGESIRLLNEVVVEQISGDPALNIRHAQGMEPELSKVIAEMNPNDYIFLAASSIDHVAAKMLTRLPVATT